MMYTNNYGTDLYCWFLYENVKINHKRRFIDTKTEKYNLNNCIFIFNYTLMFITQGLFKKKKITNNC